LTSENYKVETQCRMHSQSTTSAKAISVANKFEGVVQ